MTNLQLNQALADEMVDRILTACAEKYFAGDKRRTLDALRRRKAEVCNYFSERIGIILAEFLSQMDRTVKAIYKYEPESELDRISKTGENLIDRGGGIHLVAWVERKSPAFNALVSTLESFLIESQRKVGIGETNSTQFPLSVETVNDVDVFEKRGFGMIVGSEIIRSSQIWPKPDETEGDLLEEPKVIVEDPLLEMITSFDPVLAPESRILDHAFAIERIPPEERGALEYHLTELKVALIRKLISDQLSYINIAKNWFRIDDLADIHERRIGYGKIGGKAAGMMLAARIIEEEFDEEVSEGILIPESYFLGSDLIYIFMAMNGLIHWNDQKYKPEEQIRGEYTQIQEEFQTGEFPPEVLLSLRDILEHIDRRPLIVRSSSQLEDNFGTSFAGKYDSYFCPNQGSPQENLQALMRAIALTYASTLKPEALLYRRSKGLQDYDERMAVLIQVVQGEEFGQYFLPHASGVAFSRNIYRWSPEIRREDGFVRLVWGLGTRAVGRVGDDYPRIVALSHPTLQPDDSTEAIRRYSQHFVDLIDLQENTFKTMSVYDVLTPIYPVLRFISQLEKDGYYATPRMRVGRNEVPGLAITFHEFLSRTSFASLMAKILRTVEKHYHTSVDMEFTVHIQYPRSTNPQVRIALLQCRPQAQLQDICPVPLPKGLPPEDIIFSTRFMVPQGYLENIGYVLFVVPEEYYSIPTKSARNQITSWISHLNSVLGKKRFICVGPGRWGSINPDLGVFVSYADIYNAGALVELSGEGIGPDPEPSLGTHFFQDLMEADIYPLALRVDDENAEFNRDFFYQSQNYLNDWIEPADNLGDCLRLIDVASYRVGHHLEVVMDDMEGQAIAYLKTDE